MTTSLRGRQDGEQGRRACRNSRTNVAVAAEFPTAAGRRFATVVEALGPDGHIVVERAMYSNAAGVTWAAGTAAAATPLP